MLTQQEAEEAYSILIDWLDKNQRDDIISELIKEISAGRRVKREVSVPVERVDAFAGRVIKTSTSKTEFIGREDFKSREKLELLIDVLELSYIAPGKMADRLLNEISKGGKNLSDLKVIFTSDDKRDEIPSTEIQIETISRFNASFEKLQELLKQLRSDLPNAS